jgi:hypothetical protein
MESRKRGEELVSMSRLILWIIDVRRSGLASLTRAAPFRRACVVSAVLWLAATANGQIITQADWTPPPEGDATIWEEMERPLQSSLEEDVDTLIEQLGSPSYELRLAAQTRLMDIGPRAFPQLRRAYVATDEIEMQLQIEQIVHDGYLDFFVYGRNAFLGIQQNQHPATRDEDLRIAAGRVGIRVAEVIPDTAAQSSGFERGDIIIALDGEQIPQGPLNLANQSFGESIRVRGPGARVVFTILRDKDQIEKTVVLGSRPKRFYQRQGVVSNMLDFFRARFGDFWVGYFGSAVEE